MRRQYDAMVASGQLDRGHHVQGLAFGGDNTGDNIMHTGESTIQRKQLTTEQQLQYFNEGFTKNSDYKVAKIVEDPNGTIIKNGKTYSFGLNKSHTEATIFQNKVIKWQREVGIRYE